MKIGMICGNFPARPCGVGDQSAHLALALARRRHEVHVFTAAAPEIASLSEWFGAQGVTVHPHVRGWGRAGVTAAIRWLQQLAPDVAHIQYETAVYNFRAAIHAAPRRIRSALGPPTVITLHDLWGPYLFPGAGRTPLRRLCLRRFVSSADAWIVSNPRHQHDLLTVSTTAGERAHVIPVGPGVAPTAEPADRDDGRRRLQADAEEVLIGHFGLMQPGTGKGIESLLEAFAAVARDGAAVRLIMIGGDRGRSGDYLTSLKRHADSLGVGDRVTWTGHVDPFRRQTDASRLLAALDVAVFPFADGVNLHRSSFISAICHGCPVITTVAGAAPEVLRHGENVMLYPVNAPEQLAPLIRELVDSAELRHRLRRRALELATEFDWNRIAGLVEQVYHEAAEHISPR